MAKTCPHCQSSDFDVDPARGDTVCTSCGIVLEENTIVSEVTIQENADGSSSVVGQFVSSEGGYKPHLSGFQYGLRNESRQATLNRGKQEIRELAGMLNLNRHCVDTAHNFFKMAIAKRFSCGRRIKHIVAACVYMTCRTESTPHLLLDFSDLTQVNVFVLGRTFLSLAKELHINLPVLDPCIYITRFAHRLDFGDKTHDVTITAMRLIARMKRDWLHTGRRPSGVCGAALLVAARMHGYTCAIHDIVRVVKIGHETIRKRLSEFECTPSSKLTINEFMEIDLEAEHDPPSFTNNRIKAKLQQFENDVGGMTIIENEIGKISTEIDNELTKQSESSSKRKKKVTPSAQVAPPADDQSNNDPDLVVSANFVHSEDPLLVAHTILSPERKEQTDTQIGVGPAPTAASLGLNSTIVECMALPDKLTDDGSDEDGELDLDGIDDEEINTLLLSPNECAIKTRIWMLEHGEFLKQMEEKRELQRQEEEKKGKTRPRRNKTVKRKDYYGASRTAGEAIEKLMSRQKLSNKINYEALRKLSEDEVKDLKQAPSPAPSAAPIILKELPVTPSMKRKAVEESVVEVKKGKRENKPREVALMQFDQPSESNVLEKEVVEDTSDLPPPVDEEDEDLDDEEEDEDEHSCMSVSQLLMHSGVSTGGYGAEADDAYDYD